MYISTTYISNYKDILFTSLIHFDKNRIAPERCLTSLNISTLNLFRANTLTFGQKQKKEADGAGRETYETKKLAFHSCRLVKIKAKNISLLALKQVFGRTHKRTWLDGV